MWTRAPAGSCKGGGTCPLEMFGAVAVTVITCVLRATTKKVDLPLEKNPVGAHKRGSTKLFIFRSNKVTDYFWYFRLIPNCCKF